MHLQTEYHYYYQSGHVAKCYNKKTVNRISFKNIVIYTQSLFLSTCQIPFTVIVCNSVNVKLLDSSVQKIIIEPSASDHFFANRAYFSIQKEYHLEFSSGVRKIISAYRYGDVILRLSHKDGSEVISKIKKMSWALSLGYTIFNTTFH